MKNIIFFGGSSKISLEIFNKLKKKNNIFRLTTKNLFKDKKSFLLRDYNEKNIRNCLDKIKKKFDCAIIFNGIFKFSKFTNFNKKNFLKVVNINFIKPIEIAKILIKNGYLQKNGLIIFFSSIAGREFKIGNFDYSVSKNAIYFASKIIFNEIKNVKIATFSIGIVKNKMSNDIIKFYKLKKIKIIPLKINKIIRKINLILNEKKIKFFDVYLKHIEKKCL